MNNLQPMMSKTSRIFFSLLHLGILACVIYITITRMMPQTPLYQRDFDREEIPSGCTVFTVSKDGQVFFGGNDDWINPDSYYWVDPGDPEHYGAIWIGPPDNVQQGVNQKGLAYDANGLPEVEINPHLERISVSGSWSDYVIQILQECATVEEVITWINTHQLQSTLDAQLHFADAAGDAVIISAGADGELVFNRKPKGDGFLVSTNFNVANPANRHGGYPSWRFDTATEQLSELVSQRDELSVRDATTILDAVHIDGGTTWTIGSLLADLPNGVVYLYSYHQFDRPLVLNVAEEIANPPAPGALSRLFPEEVQQEASRRYQRILANQKLCPRIGKTWAALAVASLLVLVIFSVKASRRSVFWVPVIIILGPLGLLVWLVAGRKQALSPWRAVLVESAGDVTPVVLAFMLGWAVFFWVPSAESSQLLQLLFYFGLPFLISWLIFQGPLLSMATQQRYFRTLSQRLLPAWVVSNLGMAGLNSLAAPLIHWIMNTCIIVPMTPWLVVSIWVMAIAGALIAFLLLGIYHFWCVRYGFRAWSNLLSSICVVTSPTGPKLWGWLVFSFAALVGGIITSSLIQGWL